MASDSNAESSMSGTEGQAGFRTTTAWVLLLVQESFPVPSSGLSYDVTRHAVCLMMTWQHASCPFLPLKKIY